MIKTKSPAIWFCCDSAPCGNKGLWNDIVPPRDCLLGGCEKLGWLRGNAASELNLLNMKNNLDIYQIAFRESLRADAMTNATRFRDAAYKDAMSRIRD